MKDVNPQILKNFSKHLQECQTVCRQMPDELTELEDYLKKLSRYVEKYDRINQKTENGEEIEVTENEEDLQSCELSFSVKEEISDGRTPVEIIVVPPAEPLTIITHPTKKDFRVVSNDSEIGIYFIQDVIPVNFINVIQRELLTLTDLFPSVAIIVNEMKKEFDHFKVCCGCLKKVSPLLPDILKELQELIKFIKKKRKESYFWPDDSDYLRKSRERLSEQFKKEELHSNGKKVREETVGFVTVHTKPGDMTFGEVESFVFGEHARNQRSEYQMRQCSVRLIDCSQLSLFRPVTQSDVTFFEKLETVEKVNPLVRSSNARDKSFPMEFSIAQVLRMLHPTPVLERAIQLKITGRIAHSPPGSIPRGVKFVTLDCEELENPVALQAKEFLMTARLALGEACQSLLHKGKMEAEQELKVDVRHLKDLMLQAHKNQIELSKVLLEKGVLSAAIVQLTDPKILYDEKRGIEKANSCLIDGGGILENPTVEQLQRLVEDLKIRCNMKNRMIVALLNGLRSNVPKQHWEDLIRYVLREAGTENLEDFFQKSSPPAPEHNQLLERCQDWKTSPVKEFGVEEVLSEREVKRTCGRGKKQGKDRARISFSEVISNRSKCLQAVDTDSKLGSRAWPPQRSLRTPRGLKEMKQEAEKLLRHVGNEVNSMINGHNRTGVEGHVTGGSRMMKVKPADGETVGNDGESATINLTIKIGDEETMSQYQSAVSVIPSGTVLTGKKSEMSLPSVVDRVPNIDYVGGDSDTTRRRKASASGSFTSVALKFKVPVMFREDGGSGNTTINEEKPAPKGVIIAAEPKVESEIQFSFNPIQIENITAVDVSTTKSSNEKVSGKPMAESQSGTSTLYPQINIYCEQNTKMQKLRSRLTFLEESLRRLTRTIDRMDLLTDKLADDAYESSENFKEISDRYSHMSHRLPR